MDWSVVEKEAKVLEAAANLSKHRSGQKYVTLSLSV